LLVQTTDFFKPPFKQVGTRFVKLAAVFYAALILAAAVLGVFTGQDVFALGDRAALNLFIGVIVACGTVISGLVIYRLIPVLRGLSDELAPHLVDGARRRDLVLVSILSGVGEEVFFRGALQPLVGLVVASLLFGALHVGPDRRYLVWTLWAVAAGFLFGALYLWTGGILAPVTAHVLHNAATLLLWKRFRRREGSGAASGGSGGDPALGAARRDATVRGQG
jgi:membrane protease YdiL (CAAX protease family)